MVTNLVLKFLPFYKRFVSPALGSIFGGSCRFMPTCSNYAYQVIEKYGLIKGLPMALKRISKCHPFTKSGYDPVI